MVGNIIVALDYTGVLPFAFCKLHNKQTLTKQKCIDLCTLPGQKWYLRRSGCEDKVKIWLQSPLDRFGTNLSFPAHRMLLSPMKFCEPPNGICVVYYKLIFGDSIYLWFKRYGFESLWAMQTPNWHFSTRAKVTSNKNAHNFWHLFWAQFSMLRCDSFCPQC